MLHCIHDDISPDVALHSWWYIAWCYIVFMMIFCRMFQCIHDDILPDVSLYSWWYIDWCCIAFMMIYCLMLYLYSWWYIAWCFIVFMMIYCLMFHCIHDDILPDVTLHSWWYIAWCYITFMMIYFLILHWIHNNIVPDITLHSLWYIVWCCIVFLIYCLIMHTISKKVWVWVKVLCSVRTFKITLDEHLSLRTNHQSRHQSTSEIGHQLFDCSLPLQSCSRVCVGMFGSTYSLYQPLASTWTRVNTRPDILQWCISHHAESASSE